MVSYAKVKRQIEQKCKNDRSAYVTTLIDYYALPSKFPTFSSSGDSITRVKAATKAFQVDIAQANLQRMNLKVCCLARLQPLVTGLTTAMRLLS